MNDFRRRARRESFIIVPETCPAVDDAIHVAVSQIKEQAGKLREALDDALARAIEAEDKVSELEDEVAHLQKEVEHLTVNHGDSEDR
jgi:uncharacterized coiled-coil DUF342 family protein